MRIFFSVVIPVYNRKHLLKPVIDSVLNQAYSDFELLIVDDGSTDNTGEFIANNYNDPRIKYFYKDNEERGAARNFGLQKATGNYAVFLDSDDLMKANYLDTLLEIIKENPAHDFIAAKYNFLYPDGKEVPSPMQSLKEGFYDFNFFLRGNSLSCNFCIKLFGFNYYSFPIERELASMEDWLFVLLNTRNQPIFIKDKVCVHMQQHDDRSMLQNKKVIEARKKATDWALEKFELASSQVKELRTWTHYFCAVHQYLDGSRQQAIKEILSAIRLGGLKYKFIKVFVKAIIGRKLIKSYK
jgi:glycosyltransferase involved in cell wall biosynthesis